MARVVRGPDGREWTLNRRMSWANPVTVDNFEHDVSGGYGPLLVMSLVLALLVVVLVAWTPVGLILPGWLVFVFVVILLAFPAQWMLRRPWTIVAETEEDPNDERPQEHWVGTVHGVYRARRELVRVAKDIELSSLPHVEGPLHPVD